MDPPLWNVKDATRLPLAPSSACSAMMVGSDRCFYVKCTDKSLEQIILLQYYNLYFKASSPNYSIVQTREYFNRIVESALYIQ
jgi:hypothetical protein